MISIWWNESTNASDSATILVLKLHRLQRNLKFWSRHTVGVLILKKKEVSEKIDEIDKMEEDNGLKKEDIELRKQLKNLLNDLAKKEEIY